MRRVLLYTGVMHMRHFLRHFIGVAAALLACGAQGASVTLTGVIGDKAAVLSIDGGSPHAVRVGRVRDGVKVLEVGEKSATVEVDGQRRVLPLGEFYGSRSANAGRESVTLAADTRGHFVTEGSVNGGQVRFLVDTGATLVVLPAAEADRLAIDYKKAPRGMTQTANGPAPAYRIRLDTLKVGDIELHNVDAVVIGNGLPIALLGMSFLNRVEMTRDGQTMVLRRRY